MRNFIISFLTVLLVSFSVCAAQQNQEGINTTQQSSVPKNATTQATVKPNEEGTKQAEVKPNGLVENPTPAVSKNETAANPKMPITDKQNSSTQGVIAAKTEAPAATVQTETKQNASKAEINNKEPTDKVEEAVTQKTSENVAPTKQTMTDGTKPTETADKAVNDTKTNGKDKSATIPNETAKSTESPKQVLETRAFDGASFVGGIVLTLGLLAISFVGFKYYKNLTKENYHIL